MVNKLTLPAKENAVQNKINEVIDALGTATGANTDLSNLSATGESHFQEPLISGTNIKSINSISLLGNGNIDTKEIFVAYTYTGFQDIINAYNSGKIVLLKDAFVYYLVDTSASSALFASYDTSNDTIYKIQINSDGTFNTTTFDVANNTLSNVSSINNNSAVATALNGKADTDLSNLSATGKTVIDGDWIYSYSQLESSVSPKASTPLPISLSSYLPNDSYKYEVIIGCALTSGTTVSALNNCIISSDIITEGIRVCQVVCQVANKTNSNAAAIILPVGSGRSLSMARNNNWSGSTNIFVYGYRRIGTNT